MGCNCGKSFGGTNSSGRVVTSIASPRTNTSNTRVVNSPNLQKKIIRKTV